MSDGSGPQPTQVHHHQLYSTHLATCPQTYADHCFQQIACPDERNASSQQCNRSTSQTHHNPRRTDQIPADTTTSTCTTHNFTDTVNIITYNARTMNDAPPSTYVKKADRNKDPLGTSSINASVGGQFQLLQQRLLDGNIDVACVQETRSSMPTTTFKHFEFVHNAAVSGHGGVAIFIRRCKHLQLLEHRAFGKRILLVRIKVHGRILWVISAHGPPQLAHAAVHGDFCSCMSQALEMVARGSTVIGADLNLHLQPLREFINSDLTGPYCSDDALSRQRHGLPLVRTLASHSLHFANTLLAPPNLDTIHTWRHPRFRHACPTIPATIRDQLRQPGHQQIDFCLVSPDLMQVTSFCRPLQWAFFDALNGSDHRPVQISILWQLTTPDKSRRGQRGVTVKPRRLLRAPVDDEHLRRYQAGIAAAVEGSEWWNYNPSDAVQIIQLAAIDTLEATHVPGDTPKVSWMHPATWKLLVALNALRREFEAWCRGTASTHGIAAAIKSVADCICEVPAKNWKRGDFQVALPLAGDNHGTCLREQVLRFIVTTARRTRHALQHQKRRWFHRQCGRLNTLHILRQPRQLHQALRELVKKKKKPVRALCLEDETITSDPAALTDAWAKHWVKHFNASASDENGFQFHRSDVAWEPAVVPRQFLLTTETVQNLLKHSKKFKSSPDGLHRMVWDVTPGLAAAVAWHLNTLMEQQSVPNSFRGSTIVPVHKPGKPEMSITSYRPIQLMLTESKLYARHILGHLKMLLNDAICPHQFASGRSPGADFPHFITGQLQAYAAVHKLSVGLIFLDLRAAFDCVLRELLAMDACVDINPHSVAALEKHMLTREQAVAALTHVRNHPLSLINNDLPPFLLAILRDWCSATWMQLPQTRRVTHLPLPDRERAPVSTSLMPNTGLRQGDNLSGFLFSIHLSTILAEIHAFNMERSPANIVQLPCPTFRNFSKLREGSASVTDAPLGIHCHLPPFDFDSVTAFSHIDFADDVLLPLVSTDPADVVQSTLQTLAFAEKTFRRFNFELNLGDGKTQISLHLASSHARAVWQKIKCEAVATDQLSSDSAEAGLTTAMAVEYAPGRRVTITQSYKYLGRVISPNGCMDAEVRTRLQTLRNTFNTYKRVLTSPHHTLPTRLHVFQTIVRPHALQMLHTGGNGTNKQFKKLNHEYLACLRQIARLPMHADLDDQPALIETRHVDDASLLHAMAQPTLQTLVQYHRLSFLRRMVMADNPLVKAAATVTCKGSLWPLWIEDLRSLQSMGLFSELPAPSFECVGQWIQHIILMQKSWKRVLKDNLLPRHKPSAGAVRMLSHIHVDGIAHADALLGREAMNQELELHPEQQPHIEVPAVAVFSCHLCDRTFNSSTGLATHKRAAHQLYNPLSLRITTTHCPVCLSHLGTRAAVLCHLNARLECSLIVLDSIPAPLIHTFTEQLHSLNKANTCHTRTKIPRRGRIPIVGGKPQSQSEQPANFNLIIPINID
eukprot:2322384-Amphidinium_carterae.3